MFNKKLLFFFVSLIVNSARADIQATHGMLLFGATNNYASHLPMFHSPHDYQLLMKIRLLESHPQMEVVKKHAHLIEQGVQEFTLLPKPMDLTLIATGKLKEFSADLFHGHFEKNGKNLGPVLVKIEQVLHFHKLAPDQKEAHQYFIFGDNEEFFAIHLIQGKPSFDLILKVSEVVEKPILPIILSYVPANGQILPQAGNRIGRLDGPFVKILEVIYQEIDELSF